MFSGIERGKFRIFCLSTQKRTFDRSYRDLQTVTTKEFIAKKILGKNQQEGKNNILSGTLQDCLLLIFLLLLYDNSFR